LTEEMSMMISTLPCWPARSKNSVPSLVLKRPRLVVVP